VDVALKMEQLVCHECGTSLSGWIVQGDAIILCNGCKEAEDGDAEDSGLTGEAT
jgi:hypothetical protein